MTGAEKRTDEPRAKRGAVWVRGPGLAESGLWLRPRLAGGLLAPFVFRSSPSAPQCVWLQSSSAQGNRSPPRSEGSAGCRRTDGRALRGAGTARDRNRRTHASKGAFAGPLVTASMEGLRGRPELLGALPSPAPEAGPPRHGSAGSCPVVPSPPAPTMCKACAGPGDSVQAFQTQCSQPHWRRRT